MTSQYPLATPTRQQVPVWFLLAVMTLMSATAMGFLYLGTRLAPGSNLPSEELKILSRAYDRIDQHYIYDLSEERRAELMHAAVSGMVEHLDRYSHYYPPAKDEDYNRGTRGVMTGIGIVVQTVGDQVIVLYPAPGGPAERAGIRVGDIITRVEAQAVSTSTDAVELIKGAEETEVKMTVRHGDQPPVDLTVMRGTVIIPSLKWARILDHDKRIGYVLLEKFTENSATELDVALGCLEADLGRRLAGLVFDLRQNPGGLLNTCLEITNRFVAKGKLVTLKRRNANDLPHTADPAKCTRPDLSIALLVDSGSASASEVFAGALQDHGRARLIGAQTYGKGVVQSVFSWSDRKERVKITTSYYLTPNGRNIENILRPTEEQGKGGIQPNVKIEFASRKEFHAVIRRLRRREVPRKYRAEVAALDAARDDITILRPLPAEKDVQLATALEQVRLLLREKEYHK